MALVQERIRGEDGEAEAEHGGGALAWTSGRAPEPASPLSSPSKTTTTTKTKKVSLSLCSLWYSYSVVANLGLCGCDDLSHGFAIFVRLISEHKIL